MRFLFGALSLVLMLMTGCIFSPETSFAVTHPQPVSSMPNCGECHGKEILKSAGKAYNAFDHTKEFATQHRAVATQNSNVCMSCHNPAVCADCHGHKMGVNPVHRTAQRPDRTMPHRGEYLTRHRFEGRLDPSACFKCHGRTNNAKCQACHRG